MVRRFLSRRSVLAIVTVLSLAAAFGLPDKMVWA